MKKCELLSPCGDFETLVMAIKSGCDAVYVSGKEYGARKYAKNFSTLELEKAIKYCHLYGVKIYVTVNTLISEDEFCSVISYVRKLHKMGVDALIVQDLGLISYLKEKFPNLVIHASTQAFSPNLDSISFLEKLGVSRVVLPREFSFDEVSHISSNTNVELEVFIHGALCVSYSGQCLMSSRLLSRSGNKGLCAQLCRYKYDLYNENNLCDLPFKYLLSMKDLCLESSIKKFLDLGVTSLKIEGRMKSKYYVSYVTYFYRKLIDKYYNNEELNFSEEEMYNLKVLFNRCFTKGYFNSFHDVVNPKSCNHIGVTIGKVSSISDKTKILLNKNLNQGDGIRFTNGKGMICNYIYNNKGLLVNKGLKGEYIYIDNKDNISSPGEVRKTLDVDLINKIENFSNKKIPVSFHVDAKIEKPLKVTIKCFNDEITISYGEVSQSINKPVSKKDIISKLSRLGNTPFYLEDVSFSIDDGIFIPIGNINKVRQNLIDKLIYIRENKKNKFLENDIRVKNLNINCTNDISFLVRKENQLLHLLNYNVKIYVDSYKLYKKYKSNNKVFYRPSRASFNIDSLNKILVSNNGYFNNGNYLCSDIYMNVCNSYSLYLFLKYSKKVGLSPEINIKEMPKIVHNFKKRYGSLPNIEVLVYGRLELMLMKYCPISNFIDNEKNCKKCNNNSFYLDDRKGNKFQLLKDDNHSIRVMDYENINYLDQIPYLKSIGIHNFRIDLLNENCKDIEKILDIICVNKI